jgi:hypothetical protein
MVIILLIRILTRHNIIEMELLTSSKDLYQWIRCIILFVHHLRHTSSQSYDHLCSPIGIRHASSTKLFAYRPYSFSIYASQNNIQWIWIISRAVTRMKLMVKAFSHFITKVLVSSCRDISLKLHIQQKECANTCLREDNRTTSWGKEFFTLHHPHNFLSETSHCHLQKRKHITTLQP